MNAAARLAASAAVSAAVFGLLLSLLRSLGAGVSAADVFSGVRSAMPAFVCAYVACQFVQALSRAQRARILLCASLGADRTPGLFRTTLVTLVRGACADMFPARLGELSYVAMLSRGCAVPAADGLSSLSIGLLFDFLALLAVLAVAVPAAAQGLSLLGSAILLAGVCAVGTAGIFAVLPAAAAWRWERIPLFRLRPTAAALRLAREVAAAVVAARKGRVAVPALALSVAVRAAKYAGLWCLFAAVTRPLWPELSRAPVPAVLVALVAAEGAASLPVPTFLSFGAYEAGGLAALTALGFPAADSLVAMTAMHLASQIVDYTLGGAAFLVFLWSSPRAPAAEPAPTGGRRRRRGDAARLALALAALAAALAFDAWQLRAAKKRGRLSPPPPGAEAPATRGETDARDAALAAFAGKIVWTSNRAGSHDLWILDGPGAAPRRLTDSGFTDAYPRFSPDGSRIAFSRSREPWVSQRDFERWDTWVLDLATGEERLVATNACQACWCDDGAAVAFVRAGGTVLAKAGVDAPGEETLLRSGEEPLGAGVLVTLPDFAHGRFLVTLRGARRATAIFDPASRTIEELAGGCQMVWRAPGARNDTRVAWIDHPGRMKNAIRAGDAAAGRGAAATTLLDAADPWSHEYFPRFDSEGRFLVFGASAGGHEQDSEDYEIFLLDTDAPGSAPVRLTFHGGNDGWPDLWRNPERAAGASGAAGQGTQGTEATEGTETKGRPES